MGRSRSVHRLRGQPVDRVPAEGCRQSLSHRPLILGGPDTTTENLEKHGESEVMSGPLSADRFLPTFLGWCPQRWQASCLFGARGPPENLLDGQGDAETVYLAAHVQQNRQA